MIKFIKSDSNPVIKRILGSFHSVHVANPDFLKFNNEYLLYFRGQDEGYHDQIGLCSCQPENYNGTDWEFYESNPIIKVSKTSSDFDSNHILDPAAIIIDEKVFLYYSGHSIYKEKLYSVGLAISPNGLDFIKYDKNPIVAGAICPEIIKYEDEYYLFYQKKIQDNHFEIFCSKSKDGINFSINNEISVFKPSRIQGSFDEFSISTVRIFREDELFYMSYGGCNKYFDYPIAIGLARSTDLIHWERYPDNPILNRGEAGEWDEAALWFATIHRENNSYYLWYEGVGTGLELDSEESIRKSKSAREEDYGGYREFSFSQIGMAIFTGKISDFWR